MEVGRPDPTYLPTSLPPYSPTSLFSIDVRQFFSYRPRHILRMENNEPVIVAISG
jgi:hypothetical protein